MGYLNNTREGTIEIDEEAAKYIRRMFELAATGQYSLQGDP